MLIDFTVENYRSIKDPVTLSAVAAPRRASRAKTGTSAQSTARSKRIVPDEEIAQTYSVPGAGFELLPVIGIFGANASGKTNVVRAFEMFFSLMSVGEQFIARDQQVPETLLTIFTPFLLDSVTSSLPRTFQIRLYVAECVYRYSISVSHERILEEKLEILHDSHLEKNKLMFYRKWDGINSIYIWKFDTEVNDFLETLSASISQVVPFIGFLLRYFSLPQLESLKLWLNSQLRGSVFMGEQRQRSFAVAMMNRHQVVREGIVKFMRQFDVGLSDLEVMAHGKEDSNLQLLAIHQTETGRMAWPFSEESNGTQHLLSLAHKIIVCLSVGGILLEDELGSNIHPNITREIIKLFQSEKTNPKHAQLIFTSHDNTLQRHNLLRRDQVWFTEKRTDGSTNLYPLTDFKPRNDLALDQAYLDGRFGAVPILPATEDLLPQPVAESTVAETAG